jgi:flagellar biosynthesis/type III secretory pathway protein FliH
MSAVLKSGSAALRAKVRPFGARTQLQEPEPPRPDPEAVRLRAALAEAKAALAEKDDLIAGIPARIEAALAEGEDKGRAAAESMEAERLDILDRAATRALALYAEEIASLERLAPLLARTCLDKMLLDDAERVKTVSALLHGQLARLDAGAAVRIQVAAEDFPSTEALAGLAPAPCEILPSPALNSGDCTIQLSLGALEIGIDQQWGALRDMLEEMEA